MRTATGQEEKAMLPSKKKPIAEYTQAEIGALENIENLIEFFKLLLTVDKQLAEQREIDETLHHESDNNCKSFNGRAKNNW